MRGRAAIPILAFALLVATAGPVAAASSPTAPDAAIAGPNGTFVGEGVVEASGIDERVAFDVVSGSTRPASIRIGNPGADPQAFVLHGTGGGRVFGLRYSDGAADVTSDVVSGGYAMTLGAGETRTLDVHVRALDASKARERGGFRFAVTNQADPGLVDVVRAQATVAPITVSAPVGDGRVSCVASFPSRELHPGYATHVQMAFRNNTGTQQTAYGFGSLRVFDGNGTQLGQSVVPLFGPPPFPRKIPPHGTRRTYVYDLRIRWAGRLRIQPVCEGARRMGEVLLGVSRRTEPPASDAEAIDAAVNTRNSPFQSCHPGPNGEPEKGSFPPPDGRNIAAIHLRCWAEVRHEPGFDVVALNMVSPWNAPATTLDENSPWFVELPGHGNAMAARWSFVVTDRGARPYISLGTSRGAGEGKSYYYDLDRGKWEGPGWVRCGFEGFDVWFYGTGFTMQFVNSCHPGGTATPPPLHGSGSRPFTGGYAATRPLSEGDVR